MKKSADQFFTGDLVLRYVKDRGAYFEISSKDKIVGQSYESLKFWRIQLKKLFEQEKQNIEDLEILLLRTKKANNLSGNPIKSNLQRWLFDEEIIKPDEDNLRIIFTAANIDDLDRKLDELEEAYNQAKSHRISLSSQIKKKIIAVITKSSVYHQRFQISLHGEDIDVESKLISSVDQNGIVVDYSHTRKILC